MTQSDQPTPRKPQPLALSSKSGYTTMFDACERLEKLVLGQWKRGGTVMEPYDPRGLTWLTVFRSIKTFDAVLDLADKGYGEQSGMLCRSLFEDMVVARWLNIAPHETVIQRIVQHDTAVSLYYQEQAGRHTTLPDSLAHLPPLTEAQRQSIEDQEALRAGQAGRHWTGKSLPKLIAAIADGIDPTERDQLWRMHDLSYRLNNLLLHHSPHALGYVISRHIPGGGEAGLTVLSRGPSERYVRDALQSAYYSVSRLGQLVVAAGREHELQQRIASDEPLFVRLTPEVLRSTRRNDPCPCGSGRKFKQCHGR